MDETTTTSNAQIPPRPILPHSHILMSPLLSLLRFVVRSIRDGSASETRAPTATFATMLVGLLIQAVVALNQGGTLAVATILNA